LTGWKQENALQQEGTERGQSQGIQMMLTLILSVGEDPMLLETRSSILRSAGYAVAAELSSRDAMNHFPDGDFDLVLLCHSITPEDRSRLIRLIRVSGSRTPVLFVASQACDLPDALADATVDSAPEELLRGIEAVLLNRKRGPIGRDARFPFLIRSGPPADGATRSASDPSIKMRPSPAATDALGVIQDRDRGARNRARGK